MKKAFLILGIAAVAMAVSCNRDELKVNGEDSLTGHKAYMVVNIHDAGATSATRADDGGFEYGISTEYGVNDAYFYFYDEDGVFVSEATVWDGGTANDATPTENIEFTSNTVIVLNNLTSNTYPNWVVTVLNKPSDFQAPEYLKDFPATLADADAEGINKTVGETTYFTMSTTSYFDSSDTDRSDDYYFATPVVTENFSLEPISYDANGDLECTPVDIYVERLAVKVAVYTSLTPAASQATVNYYDENGDAKTYTVDLYEIETTVAGDPNADPQDEGDGEAHVGDETLYVGLLGWALDATARHSNISKKIEPTTVWTNDYFGGADADGIYFGSTWNQAGYHRSYWGESFNYGQDGADSALKDGGETPNTDSDETSSATWLNDYLKYVSLNGTLNTFGTTTADGTVEYCAENTNNTTIITSKYSPAITDVLVKAIVCQKDDEGNYYIADLVRYHGVLYEESSFLDYVLNELAATSGLNAYYDTGETDDQDQKIYAQIDASFVHLENYADGKVLVVLNSDIDETLYSHDYNSETEEYEMNEITDMSTITNILTSFCSASAYDAVGYNGGLMYYDIPIEHLNNASTYDSDSKTYSIEEANYGVVRNHYYKLTITKLENIGKGIYDPDEVIVPNPSDEDFYYYVGADIKIVSWHVVEQDVTL